MSFESDLLNKRNEINSIIDRYLLKEEGQQRVIFEAMNYSIRIGGKRLRPMLMKEAASSFSDSDDKTLELFMTAIECIHTYSLVHDDLPAMDNDDYRRGNLTTHKKYGHAVGILAGDGLLNYAYELCAKAVSGATDKERAARAFEVLSKKAGVYGMVGGQTVDVTLTGKSIDEDTIDFIYNLKTGALIEASLMCGAILAGASDEEVSAMEKIGNNIGMAFQIQDDILDITATTEELGKPALSDKKNNKTTYVTLYGMDNAVKRVLEISKEAIDMLEKLNIHNDFLKELVNYLITRKK
ncbi:MAG: polyprenyl synthetase family protein [Lachnospiraceae bacterium]|nr:polyprenyl synthetase family protein [Lachnospiraceae bacterium]